MIGRLQRSVKLMRPIGPTAAIEEAYSLPQTWFLLTCVLQSKQDGRFGLGVCPGDGVTCGICGEAWLTWGTLGPQYKSGTTETNL